MDPEILKKFDAAKKIMHDSVNEKAELLKQEFIKREKENIDAWFASRLEDMDRVASSTLKDFEEV